jgi:putative membrane protein
MSDTEIKAVDIQALERLRLEAERTLISWLRTGLSMISFGFTIYSFLQVIQQQRPESFLFPDAPRNIGLALIGIGTFALIIAAVQHRTYISKLSPALPDKPWDLAFIVSCLVAILGLVVFGSMFFTASLFG